MSFDLGLESVKLVDAVRGYTPGRAWIASTRPRRVNGQIVPTSGLVFLQFIPDPPWRRYARRASYFAALRFAYPDPGRRPPFPLQAPRDLNNTTTGKAEPR